MLQFRLIHLIYVVTLVSASLATFRIRGIVPAIVLPVFWAVVYASYSRPRAFCVYGLPLVFVSSCAGLWMIAAEPRENSRRMQCSNNLKQIALALHNYHDVYKAYPPAFVSDASGKPAHSWRVLILPFLDQEPLYRSYTFNEPWGGRNNLALLACTPSNYQCPSRLDRSPTAAAYTDYFAVIGPSAAWSGSTNRKRSDFKDPTSTTVLLVEIAGQKIAWTEPRDFTVDEVLKLVESRDEAVEGGHRSEGAFGDAPSYVRYIALADGSVRCVSTRLSPEVWSHLLTIDDGADVSLDDPAAMGIPRRGMTAAHYIRLGIWLFVVLLPAPGVWWPRSRVAPPG
jgi:hypothetical protein